MRRVKKVLIIDEKYFFSGERTVGGELWGCSENPFNSGMWMIYPSYFLVKGNNLRLDQIVHNVNINLAYQLIKNVEICINSLKRKS